MVTWRCRPISQTQRAASSSSSSSCSFCFLCSICWIPFDVSIALDRARGALMYSARVAHRSHWISLLDSSAVMIGMRVTTLHVPGLGCVLYRNSVVAATTRFPIPHPLMRVYKRALPSFLSTRSHSSLFCLLILHMLILRISSTCFFVVVIIYLLFITLQFYLPIFIPPYIHRICRCVSFIPPLL